MYKILDLFCGAGGFSHGLEQNANFKTLIGLDFEQAAIDTFNLNFKDAKGICGDITDKKVKNKIVNLAKKLKINMIIGEPPCQCFSLKGKNLGLKDERNFLFLEYLELVKKIEPELFIIENVKNLYNAVNGYFRDEIIKIIKNMGYNINCKILNAKYFGVPQNRERVFFIAHKDLFLDFPKESDCLVNVRDAISDLSYLNSGEGQIQSKYKNKPQSAYQEKMRADYLQYHMASKHSKIAIAKLKMIPPECGKEHLPPNLHGKQKFSTTWGRLIWEEVSPTIDTRFDTPSNGKNSHPILHRAITPREAARLQSFHDSFLFNGTKTQVCKQIGNAVPPLLAKTIADSIISQINQENYICNKYSVYNGDAYVMIENFIKQGIRVNHIITDPPYNISKKNNFSTMNSAKRQGIDFGTWDKDFNLTEWIQSYSKILDKNGSFIIFCSYRFLSEICEVLENSNCEIKDILIWQKSNPMPRNVNRRYVQDMEFAVWAIKQKAKWVFNKPKNKPYLRSLFKAPIVSGAEKTTHPTQKSLKIMQELIAIHTNENDLILDPFMGSGSTGVAALKEKRKFIGIELEEKYYKLALERLKAI
ncbi:DNA (cytosine-5-)-methyltransferase [Campylobacter sp. LR291e]|nr:DNA (cytosine-5-)-methyltransferase [Campylobacter sp. LR196d]KAA6226206.1 DNA (cytosine-5-)-methyltransferase [Campylobacter sp. LR185c]KAA6231619.1 DNA (cytosine-5-)-methyltransferase [Campylobacter sp. LR291e]KAA8604703.1 methylase [Campylobacter sp. LR185c]